MSWTILFIQGGISSPQRMLNGGTLDGAHLEVTSVSEEPKAASILPPAATGATPIGAEISQEDKPKVSSAIQTLERVVLGRRSQNRLNCRFAITRCLSGGQRDG